MRSFSRFVAILVSILIVSAAFVAAEEKEAAFSQAELDQMLAPVALYPDTLLSQILMASTYPLEVVEASRWSRQNPGLEGARAVDAVADKDWDPSVKALVAFPQVLELMNKDLEWTRRLGEAFLIQEAQVMDTIQGLREKAYAAGTLDSMEHLRVYPDEKDIVIEPASPEIVYVPYYQPRVVYGGWWWPAYPPLYWAPPLGFHAGTTFVWSRGIHVAPGFFFSAVHWPRRHVVIVTVPKHFHEPRFRPGRHHTRLGVFHKWRHDPKHRKGVLFRHGALNRRFGTVHPRAVAPRETFRDHESRRDAASVRRPWGDRSRSETDRTRTITRPGFRSDLRSDAVRSRSEIWSQRRDSSGPGLRREPSRRPDTGGAATHRFSGGHPHSRPSQVGPSRSQRLEALRGRGVESRPSAGRGAAVESSRGSSSSWGRSGGRGRQGFRAGGGSVQSRGGMGRGGGFSR